MKSQLLAKITRRLAIKGLGAAGGAAVAGPLGAILGTVAADVLVFAGEEALDQYNDTREEIRERARKLLEARNLFEELFGVAAPIRHSFDGNHPDNAVAEAKLRAVFGMYDVTPQLDSAGEYRKLSNLEGDFIGFGGPNSTLLTRLAWEFEGRDDRHLQRSTDPIIPLRYWGLSSEDDLLIPKHRNVYCRADGKSFPTIPWPFVDSTNPQTLIFPEGNDFMGEIEHQGRTVRAFRPLDNYLLVTRLPNFIGTKRGGAPSSWPQIVLLEGNNGIGTRAAELLLEEQGVETLKYIKKELKGATSFQVMFRVFDLEQTEHGFDRFKRIEPFRIAPLNISEQDYERAHNTARTREAQSGATNS